MRELLARELELISGGFGECETDAEETGEIVVCAPDPPPPYYPPPTNPSPPPYTPPPSSGGPAPAPGPADAFDLEGDDCLMEVSQFNSAIASLQTASPTFRALMDNLNSDGHDWTVNLVNTGVAETFLATNQINWDPFGALRVHNEQGVEVGSQSAMVGLAHEIAHAAYYDDYAGASLEAAVMAAENAIIAELNSYYGNGESQRAGHTDGTPYFARSALTTDAASERPSCD